MTDNSKHSIKVTKGVVDYLAFGDPEAEETVVLLHASATGAMTLSGLATYLAPDRRVLIPNLDGYGETKLDCAKCPATFRHVQTVERFLTSLNVQQFHLIGHSMGGLIALRIARRARFQINSLTLIEPMAFGTLDPQQDKAAIEFDQKMIQDLLQAVETGTLETGLSIFIERVSQQKWEDLSDRAQVELLALIPQISEEAPLVSCDDLTVQDFRSIDLPVFLIGTENGPPPAAPIIERIAPAFPTARHETLPGVGHMAPISDPALVGRSIDEFYATLPT